MYTSPNMLVRADLNRPIPFASNSFHLCVSSPPYFKIRDYKCKGQFGLEKTPAEYITNQVKVFREVFRVLRPDASLYLNIGDTFASKRYPGIKIGDTIGIPWNLAFALRADGWYLRIDNVWNCVNKMPESVRDRSSRCHEYVFHLSKTRRYYYDEVAERKPQKTLGQKHDGKSGYRSGHPSKGGISARALNPLGGAIRSVWDFPNGNYRGSHFSVMPTALALRCVALGSSAKGVCSICGNAYVQHIDRTRIPTRPGSVTKVDSVGPEQSGNRDPQRHTTQIRVLGWVATCKCPNHKIVPARVFDPYGGAWTTVLAANQLGRQGFATELSQDYFDLARERLDQFASPAGPMPEIYVDDDTEFDF